MIRRLPGTVIEADFKREDAAEHLLVPLFLADGLMLSQVAQLTGLEPHVIQNWVKRGFLSPPQNKRYSRNQFCRIAIIRMLKDSLQLDKITKLLSHYCGRLDDDSDDLIDDFHLYLCITRLVVRAEETPMVSPRQWRAWCDQELVGAVGNLTAGDAARVSASLQVIVTAYAAGRLKREAELLLRGLKEEDCLDCLA